MAEKLEDHCVTLLEARLSEAKLAQKIGLREGKECVWE